MMLSNLPLRRLTPLALAVTLCGSAPLAAQVANPYIRFATRVVSYEDLDASGALSMGDSIELESWLQRDAGADPFAGTLTVRVASTIGLAIDEASWHLAAGSGYAQTLCDCPDDFAGTWTLAFAVAAPTEFRVRWSAVASGPLPPIVTTQWRSSLGYLKNRVLFLSNPDPAPEGWVDEFAWADWLVARIAQVAPASDPELNLALARFAVLRANPDSGAAFVDSHVAALGDSVRIRTEFTEPPSSPADYGAVVELVTTVSNIADAGDETVTVDLRDLATAGFAVDPDGFEVVALAGELLEAPGATEDLGRFVVRLPAGGEIVVRWRGTTATAEAPIFTPVVTLRAATAREAVNLPFFPKAVISGVPAAIAAADQLLARTAQVANLSDGPLVQALVSYLTVRGFQRAEPSDIGLDGDGNGD